MSWQERVTLFIGHLIENKLKLASIRSYLSAIRTVLAEDGFEFQQDSFVLTSLIKASRICNNVLVTCLPIHKVLLKLILDEVTKFGTELNQPYQKTLYLAFFAMAYYGLLHIGELTHSPHCTFSMQCACRYK